MDVLELDLRNKKNPPPDDPERAPFGWMWDKRISSYRPKKRAWRGGNAPGSHREPRPDMSSFERDVEKALEDRGFQDPAPAWQDKKPPKVPKTPVKVSAKVKGDITGFVGMLGAVLLPPVVSRDPYCGGALTEAFPAIAEAVVPLLCQSQRVVSFFTDQDNDWMLWGKLAMALAPVAQAVAQHHILKTVEIRQDPVTGDLYAGPRDLAEFTTEEEPVA